MNRKKNIHLQSCYARSSTKSIDVRFWSMSLEKGRKILVKSREIVISYSASTENRTNYPPPEELTVKSKGHPI
jgi:hypothetical protein